MDTNARNGRPLKVLFVTHKHPPSLGGMQRQSFELAGNYRKIGDARTIYYNGAYPIWLFFTIVVPWVAIRLLMERDIDLIHGNDGLMGVFLTPFLITGKALVVTIHGVDIVTSSRTYQWWVRTFLCRFSAVIAVSEPTAQECRARGISSEKTICIPNACDRYEAVEVDDAFVKWLEDKCGVALSGKIVISSVGRAVPRKGFSWFAAEVLPHLPDDIVYVVVGPKENRNAIFNLIKRILPNNWYTRLCQVIGIATDYPELVKIAARTDLARRIHILEKLSHDQLVQLYAYSKIFVMPNLKVAGDFEGFGLVAQEAVANGALCVAANIDGIPSAIEDGKTGILLPANDPPAWIRAISDLSADRCALENMAREFRENFRAIGYSWMDMAIRYRDCFERIAADGRRRAAV